MNSRLEIASWIFIWVLAGGFTDGVPITDSPLDPTNASEATANPGNILVPQIGVLEDRPDVTSASASSSNNANGILLPIVSVVDANDSSTKKASPLVALLPAPARVPGELPEIGTLPILPVPGNSQTAGQPEVNAPGADLPV